jgi:hypothetical protein
VKRLLGVLLLALTGPAAADEPGEPVEPAPQVPGCASIVDDAARLACYDGLTRQPVPRPEDTFGMRKPDSQGEPDELRSRLVGKLASWRPGTEFALENGQVWQAIDGDSGYYPGIPENASIAISKSFFGAYWMKIDTVGRKVKVRRVR